MRVLGGVEKTYKAELYGKNRGKRQAGSGEDAILPSHALESHE